MPSLTNPKFLFPSFLIVRLSLQAFLQIPYKSKCSLRLSFDRVEFICSKLRVSSPSFIDLERALSVCSCPNQAASRLHRLHLVN